jgi:hypothetical protein
MRPQLQCRQPLQMPIASVFVLEFVERDARQFQDVHASQPGALLGLKDATNR